MDNCADFNKMGHVIKIQVLGFFYICPRNIDIFILFILYLYRKNQNQEL